MTIFDLHDDFCRAIYLAMARDIQATIDDLGGISQVAKDLGHRSHTSVQYWYQQNSLPRWRWAELSNLAEQRGVKMPKEQRA